MCTQRKNLEPSSLWLSGNCSALLRCRLRQSVEPYLEPRWLPAAWEEFAVAPRCGCPREGLLKNSACHSVLTAVCRVGDQLDSQSEAQTGSSGEEVQRENPYCPPVRVWKPGKRRVWFEALRVGLIQDSQTHRLYCSWSVCLWHSVWGCWSLWRL